MILTPIGLLLLGQLYQKKQLMKHPSATSFPLGPKMARRCPKIAIIQHPKPMLSILLLLLLLLLLLPFLVLLLLLLLRLLLLLSHLLLDLQRKSYSVTCFLSHARPRRIARSVNNYYYYYYYYDDDDNDNDDDDGKDEEEA